MRIISPDRSRQTCFGSSKTTSTVWTTASGKCAAKAEPPIYRRELAAGLSPSAYLLSQVHVDGANHASTPRLGHGAGCSAWWAVRTIRTRRLGTSVVAAACALWVRRHSHDHRPPEAAVAEADQLYDPTAQQWLIDVAFLRLQAVAFLALAAWALQRSAIRNAWK